MSSKKNRTSNSNNSSINNNVEIAPKMSSIKTQFSSSPIKLNSGAETSTEPKYLEEGLHSYFESSAKKNIYLEQQITELNKRVKRLEELEQDKKKYYRATTFMAYVCCVLLIAMPILTLVAFGIAQYLLGIENNIFNKVVNFIGIFSVLQCIAAPIAWKKFNDKIKKLEDKLSHYD